jgi:enamine deaminase RidA (YjgF/YER057c/UK114 family)
VPNGIQIHEFKQAVIPPAHMTMAEAYHYSPGVRAGGTLYVAGQIGQRPDGSIAEDPIEQTVIAFENLKDVLANGGFTFGDVVELMTYHRSFENFDQFMAVKDRYFLGPVFPAWTALGVTALTFPSLVFEVKCTAVKGVTR